MSNDSMGANGWRCSCVCNLGDPELTEELVIIVYLTT